MLLNFQNVEDVKKVLNNLTSSEKLELASNIYRGRNQSDFIDSKGNFIGELDKETDIDNFYKELNNILKGFSIYQSNFEMKTGLINSILNSKLLYTHVVGHGLIINMKTLNELGNFNTKFWCEDIYLGLQLKFNNIKITPLLTLENMETPSSLENLIKQNSVWFKTTSQFSKIYKDIIKNYKVTNKLNGLIGCFNEFRCALNWIGFPIILLLGALILKNYLIVLLIIASYLLYICINTKMTIKLINILDEQDYKTSLKIIFFTAIATVISNIGPIYSIISNKKVKHKTER